MHGESAFCTFTYSDEHLPEGATLVPRDLTLMWKRMRKAGREVRYFVAGEYGDETQRPHYHAAIFGQPGCLNGRTNHRLRVCCTRCTELQNFWGLGGIDLAELSMESAGYIAGYVVKKMTSKYDERLNGRHPEFARMSRKPGLGAPAIRAIADVVVRQGTKLLNETGDVPVKLFGAKAKSIPLGRYLRRKLREEVGFEDIGAPQETLRQQAEEMRALYESTGPNGYKAAVIESNAIASLENRMKIRRSKKL